MPRYLQPLVETVNFVTIALLPDRIRDDYGFAPLPPAFVRKALVRAGAEYVRRGWFRSCRAGCGWFPQHALLRLHRDQAGGQGLEPR